LGRGRIEGFVEGRLEEKRGDKIYKRLDERKRGRYGYKGRKKM
jgi:hypothetical protein